MSLREVLPLARVAQLQREGVAPGASPWILSSGEGGGEGGAEKVPALPPYTLESSPFAWHGQRHSTGVNLSALAWHVGTWRGPDSHCRPRAGSQKPSTRHHSATQLPPGHFRAPEQPSQVTTAQAPRLVTCFREPGSPKCSPRTADESTHTPIPSDFRVPPKGLCGSDK